MYEFQKNDIYRNRIKAFPKYDWRLETNTSGTGSIIYYNCNLDISGTFIDHVNHVSGGFLSLDELNVDRPSDSLVYPYYIKTSKRTAPKTISLYEFDSSFAYGDVITGTYPLSASMTREYYYSSDMSDYATCGQNRKHIEALKNTLNYYKHLSPHYAYSSSYGDKQTQRVTLIDLPTIFYGSSIDKGSVYMTFCWYDTANANYQKKVLTDAKRNGELIDEDTGDVAGVVLYKEGFLLITGSYSIGDTYSGSFNDCPDRLTAPDNPDNPRWVYWGKPAFVTGSGGTIHSASYGLSYKGTTYTDVLTMFVHAPKGELNHSNNPTYIEYGQNLTGSTVGENNYVENKRLEIKNTVPTRFADPQPDFEKQTYLSGVLLYDKDKKVIGICKLATPIRKPGNRGVSLKCVLDL